MRNLIPIIFTLLLFTSCANIGYIAGGKNTTYEGSYTLPTKGSIEASKSKLKEVLFSSGWNKSKEEDAKLIFENQSTKGSEIGLGKVNKSTIEAKFNSDGSINLLITQFGNYNFGTEKAVNETFDKIKSQYKL